MQTADVVMKKMLETFLERKARYGLNYLMIGRVMHTLFPDGITLNSVEGWNRMHLFLMQMVKATRLANTNLTHEDSAHDSAVYGAMLNGLLLPGDGEFDLPLIHPNDVETIGELRTKIGQLATREMKFINAIQNLIKEQSWTSSPAALDAEQLIAEAEKEWQSRQ